MTDPKSLILKSEPAGWYKLYLFNPASTAEGDAVGDTTFSIIPRNSNFPNEDDFYKIGGYYAGTKFEKVKTQIDPTINLNLSIGQPNPGDNTTIASSGNNPFAIKWTGQISASTTDTYTFYFNSTPDSARLTINGTTLINSVDGYNTTDSGAATISLQAGQHYDIELEYVYDAGGGPLFNPLTWSNSTMGQTLVPQSALYSSSNAVSPDGLTGTYYKATEYQSQNDQTVRGITGMGPNRYEVDVTSPSALADSTSTLESELSVDENLYVGKDSQRPRPLLISFGPGTAGHLAQVAEVVNEFKDRVKYYEPRNEPNDTDATTFVNNEMIPFYNTIHGIDSSLKVLGPGNVSITGGGGIGWLSQFLAAGGGNYINALSFHAYNDFNGDFVQGVRSMEGLKTLLHQYSLDNIEKWQTEQGYFAAEYGLYDPRHQGQWTMSEMMVLEQYALPKEHNVLWYDISHGFNDFPTWWENSDGGVNPAVPLMNTWSQELFGTNYSSAYDFGTSTTKMYLGSLFSGPSKNVAVFMSNGMTDGHVNLSVNTGSSIHVVDAWGNAQDIPVSQGKVTLAVDELPVYVELASGQTASVIKDNFGPDLALLPGTTVAVSSTAAGGNNSPTKLIDGVLQNWYYNFGADDHPWISDNISSSPITVEIDLASTTNVNHVIVYAPRPWQQQGAPLDYYLQYYDATSSAWINIEHVQENPKTFGTYSVPNNTTVDTYYSSRSLFDHAFPAVSTSKIRLLVNSVTWGGGATQETNQAGGQTSGPALSLQEVEIYGQ